MIRILLGVAVAAAAFFGPWAINGANLIDAAPDVIVHGEDFAGTTIDCLRAKNWSVTGDCAPNGAILGKAITATVIFGLGSAVLGIIGLIPFVGRLTSITSVIAGGLAVTSLGIISYCALTVDGTSFSELQWGAYATGVFGLLTIFSGLAGMRGHE